MVPGGPDADPLPDLQTLGVVLTTDCNLRCRYCYQDRHHAAAMPWSVLRAGLDLLPCGRGPGPCKVSFLGGEPLLEYALVGRALRYLARRESGGPHVGSALVTNGTLLDARRLRSLLARGVQIFLSFDGAEAAQDLRGPGTFRRLDRLVSFLREQLPGEFANQVSVTMVTHPPALASLADSVEYLLGAQVHDVLVAAAMGTWPWRLQDIEQLEQQFARVFDASRRHYEATGRVPVTVLRKTGPDPTRPLGSWSCGICSERSVVIDVDGQVYPCAMLIRSCQEVAPGPMGERLGRLSLGQVGEPGLAERLSGLPPIARDLEIFARQDHKWSSYGKCAECPSVGVCVICPVAARKDRRLTDPLQVPDFMCAFNRVAFDCRRRFPYFSA